MQSFSTNSGNHVTWREADKSWLKAKGRSFRSMLDSTRHHDGSRRYFAAAIATIVIASAVGLSSVIAGPGAAGGVVKSTLSPLGGLADRFSGTPASAHPLEECGPLAEDVAGSSDVNAGSDTDASVDTRINDTLPPIGPGLIPLDLPTDPPAGNPPSDDPDDDEPPVEPPEDDPPNDPQPPTEQPAESDLIGADVDLLGQDIVEVGILNGGLLGVGVNGLDPDGSGTESIVSVTDGNGDEIIGANADPQSDDIVDLNVNDEDVLDGVGGGDVGTNLIEQVVDDVLGGDVLGGDDPLGGLLGDEPLGGLLN